MIINMIVCYQLKGYELAKVNRCQGQIAFFENVPVLMLL